MCYSCCDLHVLHASLRCACERGLCLYWSLTLAAPPTLPSLLTEGHQACSEEKIYSHSRLLCANM